MLSQFRTLIFKRSFTTSLEEIGCLNDSSLTENYKTGQMFLHRLFGYRGVILCQWQSAVLDRDLTKKQKNTEDPEESELKKKLMNKNNKIRNTYYTVLMDGRDCPFVKAQNSSVTFLGDTYNGGKALYTIPGMNYVSHEDVLPYTSTEEQPLKHELVNQLFTYQKGADPPFKAQETLIRWKQQNCAYLKVFEVHKETTEDIKVTVIPFFMGAQDSLHPKVYWWRYWICLENIGEMSVQLKRRFWRVFSVSGGMESVRGRGVLGQEPILSASVPGFQYISHVSLEGPEGHMWGRLSVKRDDGHVFDCKIPNFPLKSTKLNIDYGSESE